MILVPHLFNRVLMMLKVFDARMTFKETFFWKTVSINGKDEHEG